MVKNAPNLTFLVSKWKRMNQGIFWWQNQLNQKRFSTLKLSRKAKKPGYAASKVKLESDSPITSLTNILVKNAPNLTFLVSKWKKMNQGIFWWQNQLNQRTFSTPKLSRKAKNGLHVREPSCNCMERRRQANTSNGCQMVKNAPNLTFLVSKWKRMNQGIFWWQNQLNHKRFSTPKLSRKAKNRHCCQQSWGESDSPVTYLTSRRARWDTMR